MTRKSVHQITMSRQEIARATRSGALMTPMTAAELEAHTAKQRADMAKIVAGKGSKARREMKNVEHRAQRHLYQELIPAAQSRHPLLAHWLDAVYAIPVFNVNHGDKDLQRMAQIQGSRLKLEGMKAGSPDNHVPVQRNIPGPLGMFCYGSLFLELKANSYPNEAQRERFPQLARCGNAVVTVRTGNDDDIELADKALETIVLYLKGVHDFYRHGHPSFTYVHNTTLPLAQYEVPQ